MLVSGIIFCIFLPMTLDEITNDITNDRDEIKTFMLKSRKKGLFRELPIQLKKENRFT